MFCLYAHVRVGLSSYIYMCVWGDGYNLHSHQTIQRVLNVFFKKKNSFFLVFYGWPADGGKQVDNDPPLGFVQIFNLYPEGPGSYFIYNDVFRLIVH